ncbi:hypothetical protein DU500_08910 [Haloplanus rubicundus]|uniref:Uncharacterized protein n=2 Tax=Haloplanus rubicundus TaxID=1547898 RepID=A0A345E2W1_9EURY|nr:hypothetical protein DU500_08910 [Haloplanus rubicundus]
MDRSRRRVATAMTTEESGALEDRIDLYTTLWSVFRDRPFESDELARQLVERGRHELVSTTAEPDASLAWLVDAGVVTADGSAYRVTDLPNDAARALADAAAADVETVRRQVLAALTAPDEESETVVVDDDGYTVVELGVGESMDAAADRVVEAAADGEGVAVTTPGTNAAAAQRLADRLIADRSWSKAGSTVVEGDHEDAELVFHLYLDTD